jgi:hypothetical protein
MPTTNDAIIELYARHSVAVSNPDDIDAANLHKLVSYALMPDSLLNIDGDHIVLNSLPESSSIRHINIDNIRGFEVLKTHFAIILSDSIFFIDKASGNVHIHLKPIETANN